MNPHSSPSEGPLLHLAPGRRGTGHQGPARIFRAAGAAIAILFPLAFAASGYPRARVALAIAFHLAPMAGGLVHVSLRLGGANPHGGRRARLWRALVPLVACLASAGVTGGLHSPFFVLAIGPYSGALLKEGWSPVSKAAAAVLGAGLVLLAVLPSRVLGPALPDPALSFLMALALAITALLYTLQFAGVARALRESQDDVDRMGDQMLGRAVTRTRELEQMSAQLSHELKNPLTAIKTFVQLSVRRATDADSREQLGLAESEVERAQGILQSYLTFSRPLGPLRLENVELAALTDDLLRFLGARARRAGISLRREGHVDVRADPASLREALFNLLTNALDATGPGGSVEVGLAQDDGQVHITVSDSGRGMTPDVLARLGTAFFTTRENGTGLGVALARAAFVQHGGSLDYESIPGRGTVARVVLPRRGA